MADFTIREFKADDVPALVSLWQEIFGDTAHVVSEFFRILPGMGNCVVAELGGEIVGMTSVITGLELVTEEKTSRCGYIYAVAAKSAARHRGIGAALTRRACEWAKEHGAELLCTLPAEDSLYAWYDELMGVNCALYRSSFETAPVSGKDVKKISAEEYLALREKLLSGKNHLRGNAAVIEFAEVFYGSYGGGLFRCGDAVCAAYGDEKAISIKELITPCNDAEAVAASLGAHLGTEKVIYFLPSTEGSKYLSTPAGAVPADCIWNLTFD